MPHVETYQSSCRFGLARRDVTPPVGIYHRMWGAAAHDRSVGVHRPLTASAMVFQPPSGEGRQILVALDHCLLWEREMQQLIDRVSRQASIPPDQLIVTFSHTHAAGLMEASRADLPGGDLIAPYLERMATHVAEAIQEAIATVAPADVVYTTGSCSLAAHRDYWDKENGIFVCGLNPGGPADDAVLVARVTDARANLVATIVNYACHPTTLAWDNQAISPDFVGAMREVVEAATGAPSVFLQGASGDLGPRHGFLGDAEVADRNGRQLGYAVLSALQAAPPPNSQLDYQGPVISGATIGVWRFRPLDESQRQAKQRWQFTRFTVDLPYRDGLPTAAEIKTRLDELVREEQAARRDGDQQRAADVRALAERQRRQLTRVAALPRGERFPFPVTLLRMGDAIWVTVEGEPYNFLQTSLRERFPDTPIVVIELANGSRCSYLPTCETYGTGIYQETIAYLEKGALESLADAISEKCVAMSD